MPLWRHSGIVEDDILISAAFKAAEGTSQISRTLVSARDHHKVVSSRPTYTRSKTNFNPYENVKLYLVHASSILMPSVRYKADRPSIPAIEAAYSREEETAGTKTSIREAADGISF